MAQSNWQSTPALKQLINSPRRYDFFQAMRLLERHLTETERENMTIESKQSLNFAPSSIDSISETDTGLTLLISFLGLTGQNSTLPDHFNELVLKQIQQRDTALVDLLNIFNQRLAELSYKAWQQRHYVVDYEQQHNVDSNNHLLTIARALTGLQVFADNPANNNVDTTTLFYANHFSQQPRSKAGLEQLLENHFKLPIVIQEFIGQWIPINKSHRSKLGKEHHFNRLGQGMVIGKRIWYVANCFEVTIGEIDYNTLLILLPNTPLLSKMKQIITLYAGNILESRARINVKPDTIQPCQLGKHQHLGWNSWLKASDKSRYQSSVSFRT